LAEGRPVGYLQSIDHFEQIPVVPGGGLEAGTSGLQQQCPKPLGHTASFNCSSLSFLSLIMSL